jgi:hypothetical protein
MLNDLPANLVVIRDGARKRSGAGKDRQKLTSGMQPGAESLALSRLP